MTNETLGIDASLCTKMCFIKVREAWLIAQWRNENMDTGAIWGDEICWEQANKGDERSKSIANEAIWEGGGHVIKGAIVVIRG